MPSAGTNPTGRGALEPIARLQYSTLISIKVNDMTCSELQISLTTHIFGRSTARISDSIMDRHSLVASDYHLEPRVKTL